MSDHPGQSELGHAYGESAEDHAAHASTNHTPHWGLASKNERMLFYAFAIPSWLFNIIAGVFGSYYSTGDKKFAATATVFLFFSWAAWWQTVVQMMQRASWVRDESNLVDRRRYLYLAVRLNQLMLPTAIMSFIIFVVAYARRYDTDDVGNWLLFILVFIFNTVGCVMNAYNNITWESDRLEYEEGISLYGNTMLSILGIPSKPQSEKAIALDE